MRMSGTKPIKNTMRKSPVKQTRGGLRGALEKAKAKKEGAAPAGKPNAATVKPAEKNKAETLVKKLQAAKDKKAADKSRAEGFISKLQAAKDKKQSASSTVKPSGTTKPTSTATTKPTPATTPAMQLKKRKC